LSGIQARAELDPRLKLSGVTPLGISLIAILWASPPSLSRPSCHPSRQVEAAAPNEARAYPEIAQPSVGRNAARRNNTLISFPAQRFFPMSNRRTDTSPDRRRRSHRSCTTEYSLQPISSKRDSVH